MKKLACFINDLQSAKELILYAALLAKELKSKVCVLYIQYPLVYGTSGYMGTAVTPDPEHLQKTADEVSRKVDEIIKDIVAEYPGTPSIEFVSDIGDASAILEKKVEQGEYDMVMLQGSKEQDFWQQHATIMGIVRNVPCPVWIIQHDATYQPMKKIVYATDHNEEDLTTLKRLIVLAKPFDPEINALHISNDEEFEKKLKTEGFAAMLSEKTGYSKISVKMITDNDGSDAVEILASEAEKAKANLIVVLKENRNFFERLFKSSFTAQLVKKTQLPVLVFHKAN